MPLGSNNRKGRTREQPAFDFYSVFPASLKLLPKVIYDCVGSKAKHKEEEHVNDYVLYIMTNALYDSAQIVNPLSECVNI